MSRSLASDVYGPSLTREGARAMVNGGRAVFPLRPTLAIPTGTPVTSHAASPARSVHPELRPGFTHVPHVGAYPTTVACTCSCHGDPIGGCDDSTCS